MTTDDTATAGEDYTAVPPQTLTFAGDVDEEQTFTIDIIDDPDPENVETLTVSLDSLRGTSVAVGLSTATVIILANDNDADADDGECRGERRCRHGQGKCESRCS